MVSVSRLLTTGNVVIARGRKLQNVGPKWYIEKGGSFCSRCRLAYTFDETLSIYFRCLELGLVHGIPRCVGCGRTLRTRSKPRYQSGFWKRLDVMKNNGEFRERQKLYKGLEE